MDNNIPNFALFMPSKALTAEEVEKIRERVLKEQIELPQCKCGRGTVYDWTVRPVKILCMHCHNTIEGCTCTPLKPINNGYSINE